MVVRGLSLALVRLAGRSTRPSRLREQAGTISRGNVDRRYQVFISSTYLDLKEERRAVQEAILELDCFPAGMELFPASNEDAWTLIKGVIDSSDYYLLVIGGKYGSVDEATQLSYTEKEYDYAVSVDKPIMAFVHGDPGSIPASKTELDTSTREKLEAFREKVKASKHVKYWQSADDLAGKVSRSFTQLRKQHPAIGWIRGDVETSTESLKEIIELRKQIDDLKAQLVQAEDAASLDAQNRSQGHDEMNLSIPWKVTVYTDSEDWRQRSLDITGSSTLDASWNELFAEIGPSMIDEVHQTRLRRRLDEWLGERLAQKARDAAIAYVKRQGHGLRSEGAPTGTPTFSLRSKDFESIIVQLRALGLMTKGTRKRGVNDVGPWWVLTKLGDDQLTSLRAIRKPSDE
jgi:hypothetical protein